MKTRLALFVLTALLSTAGYSQIGNTSFGLRAGVNFQNLNGKDSEGDKLENDLKTGFHIGVNAEIPVADEFYVQPGILFSAKGARQKNVLGSEDLKVNLGYIEIPVNLLYKPVLGNGKLLLGFGPYIAFGITGKIRLGDNDTDVKWENTITVPQSISGTPYFKRLDAGANFLFGYELSSRISAQLNAQLGLVNISPKIENINDKSKINNTGFGISLGYRF